MQNNFSASISRIAEIPIPLNLAGQTERLFNYLIDSSILTIITTFFTFIIINFLNLASSNILNTDLIAGGIFVLIWTGYYWALETLWGKTPAKWITGTQVVNQKGFKPKPYQILVRTLARFVFYKYFISFYPFIRRECPLGWHDIVSGTRVIKTHKFNLEPRKIETFSLNQ